MKKVSVIVPFYKSEKTIKRCMDSILNQTYSNLELVLVNDGSPDNSGKIVSEYAKKDSRIRVIDDVLVFKCVGHKRNKRRGKHKGCCRYKEIIRVDAENLCQDKMQQK